MELVWFRGAKWIKENIKSNTPYVIFGRVNFFNGAFTMPHPEIELLTDYKKGFKTVMQSVYKSTEMLGTKGISNRVMQKLIQQLFHETKGRFEETLSDKLLNENGLIAKNDAMFNIHFPQSQELLPRAIMRHFSIIMFLL